MNNVTVDTYYIDIDYLTVLRLHFASFFNMFYLFACYVVRQIYFINTVQLLFLIHACLFVRTWIRWFRIGIVITSEKVVRNAHSLNIQCPLSGIGYFLYKVIYIHEKTAFFRVCLFILSIWKCGVCEIQREYKQAQTTPRQDLRTQRSFILLLISHQLHSHYLSLSTNVQCSVQQTQTFEFETSRKCVHVNYFFQKRHWAILWSDRRLVTEV